MARLTKRSDSRAGVSPEMLAKVKRYAALQEAHIHAIQSGEEAFYRDGRHDELCDLIGEVYQALGIRICDDDVAMVREFLEGVR